MNSPSELADYYIDTLHLQDIVMISHDFRESAAGYQDEHIAEEIVCRKSGVPRRMTVSCLRKVFKGSRVHVTADAAISAADYRKLSAQHGGPFDTPTYYKNRERGRALRAELEQLPPACPECGAAMVRRRGPRGEFFGCSQRL